MANKKFPFTGVGWVALHSALKQTKQPGALLSFEVKGGIDAGK
jgi:hypothetical protein